MKACLIIFLLTILGCGLSEHEFKKFTIYLKNKDLEEIMALTTVFSLSCPTVFTSGSSSGAFTQSGITISGASGSVQVIANNNCNLTITSFSDGTNTYAPNPTSLVLSISSSNVVTSSGTIAAPPTYTGNSTNVYLFLASSSSSTMTLVYIYDPVAEPYLYVPLLTE
jgi:hypothetical protein